MRLSLLCEERQGIKVLSWEFINGRIDWREMEGEEELPWGYHGDVNIEVSVDGSPPKLLKFTSFNPVDGPQGISLDGKRVDDDFMDEFWDVIPPLLDIQLHKGKSLRDPNVGPGHKMRKYVVPR